MIRTELKLSDVQKKQHERQVAIHASLLELEL
jgi:hypothetical protein